eukprot:TRINITY_DN5378_c0_g1_i1.p1 TRINITY_DN5378_c0_g1~~TRINITY_DN5378_c0_g1_i1.p1  ORF type:complete len:333 (+),score=101.05 TRINITY_DN5378_c0_g1_i1:224-1222(+)
MKSSWHLPPPGGALFLLLFLLGLSLGTQGLSFQEDDPRAPVDLLWEQLLRESNDLPSYGDEELMEEEDFSPPEDFRLPIELPPMDGNYPPLSRKAAEFGVNPSYNSYYEPAFKKMELEQRNPIDEEFLAQKRADEALANDYEHENDVAHKLNAKKAEISMLPRALSSTQEQEIRRNDIFFISVVAGVSALAVVSIVGAGFCYHKVQKNSRAGEEVEYPAYGVTGPGKEISPTSGDRKLAQSAQMYHYQHQKQQMIAFDRSSGSERGTPPGSGMKGGPRSNMGSMLSDGDSDEGEEGDYTVYECPGLAPTGEMEVRNPLFQDDTVTPKNGKLS